MTFIYKFTVRAAVHCKTEWIQKLKVLQEIHLFLV